MQDFEFNVKKYGLASGIDLNSDNYSKGGIKKEQVNAKYHSMFNKVDTDKNGILDNSEMAAFKAEIDKNQSGFIDKQEAKDFLYNNRDNLTYTDEKGKTKQLTGTDLNAFLSEYMSNEEIANVKTAEKVEVDGQEAVQITKNDGSRDIIFDDKDEPMRTITTDAETNAVTTDYIKDNIRQKTEVVQENGDSLVSEFEQDGTTLTRQTSVTKEMGMTEVITYENGIPSKKDVSVEVKEWHYEYDETGEQAYLLHEIENRGNDVLQKVTDYEYPDENTCIATTEQPGGRHTITTRVNDKITNEVNITGNPDNPDKKIETDFNEEGFKTSQIITEGGNTYTADFDGYGHAQFVLKAGESWEGFSRRTGVPMSEIKELNNTNKGPQAGQKVLVPEKYAEITKVENLAVDQGAEKQRGDNAEVRRQERQKKKYSKFRLSRLPKPGRLISISLIRPFPMPQDQADTKIGTIIHQD